MKYTLPEKIQILIREEINENEQKPIEIQNENTEDKKWVFKPTIKPKLPTVRAKARELRLKDYDEKKKY